MAFEITKLVGADFPLFAFSHCRDVVAAVSRAGGFGVLGGARFTPESLEQELKWIDAHVDGKPYGIDILIPEHQAVKPGTNADAIAAVPGVDVLLIGTNDLAMEMGIPGEFNHAEIARAYERVIAACRRHNKAPGMGGVYTEELLAKYIGLGMRMILSGNDFSLIMTGGGQKTKFMRGLG